MARVPLPSIRAILITHQHSDHNADYGNLVMFAWIAGLRAPIDTYGPPPLEKMTRLFLEMNAYNLEVRQRDEGRPPLAPSIRAHEIDKDGLVFDDGRVKVTAALNRPSSGDAIVRVSLRHAWSVHRIFRRHERVREVIRLAQGADVLVHEVMHVPAIGPLLDGDPNATRLREHLLASHTTTEDVGRVAAEANVKTLVLSHFVPGNAELPDDAWAAGARKLFKGRIIVGADLMEI